MKNITSLFWALNSKSALSAVLHMDKNDYYGGESCSLNLTQLWKRFRGNDQPLEQLGASREYNVDMIPKFKMANGTLIGVLAHAYVTKHLNLQAVDGSFVYNKERKYELEDDTIDFIGHDLALHTYDSYLDQPAMDFVKRMKVEFGGDGKVIGVTSEGETAKCKKVVCDPSYLPDEVLDLPVDLSSASAVAEE